MIQVRQHGDTHAPAKLELKLWGLRLTMKHNHISNLHKMYSTCFNMLRIPWKWTERTNTKPASILHENMWYLAHMCHISKTVTPLFLSFWSIIRSLVFWPRLLPNDPAGSPEKRASPAHLGRSPPRKLSLLHVYHMISPQDKVTMIFVCKLSGLCCITYRAIYIELIRYYASTTTPLQSYHCVLYTSYKVFDV